MFSTRCWNLQASLRFPRWWSRWNAHSPRFEKKSQGMWIQTRKSIRLRRHVRFRCWWWRLDQLQGIRQAHDSKALWNWHNRRYWKNFRIFWLIEQRIHKSIRFDGLCLIITWGTDLIRSQVNGQILQSKRKRSDRSGVIRQIQ